MEVIGTTKREKNTLWRRKPRHAKRKTAENDYQISKPPAIQPASHAASQQANLQAKQPARQPVSEPATHQTSTHKCKIDLTMSGLNRGTGTDGTIFQNTFDTALINPCVGPDQFQRGCPRLGSPQHWCHNAWVQTYKNHPIMH